MLSSSRDPEANNLQVAERKDERPDEAAVRGETLFSVLLVEDNPGDARLVCEMLLEVGTAQYRITHVDRLSRALQLLVEGGFDAVLLDLGLPDAQGLDAVTPIINAAPDMPIVVLSGLEDERIAVQAVQLGAQDYIVKGIANGTIVARSIRYAIERKRSEEYINHVANHDSLTNLPNRRLLVDRLTQAVARARRSNNLLAVMFVDLDHFKTINDTLGHTVGDLLLQAVAARLTASTRQSDTVARLGGDEFVLVLPDIMRTDVISSLAGKIREELKPRFQLGRHELFVSASIGVSLYPVDGEDAEALLRHADAAMYRAKQCGRNTFQFYSPSVKVKSDQLALGVDLRRALDRDEFLLHYQPQVDLHSGKLTGMEALLRWRHPERGLVPPSEFIPLAEESGLIVQIGEWVLRRVCAQGQAWQAAGVPPIRVAVNLSSRQFHQSSLLHSVIRALKETGLHPRYLELELTESGIMHNEEMAISILKQLKAMGIRIAIDDFGTGYSSLNHLKRFPIDALKIDQSFIRDLTHDSNDAAIVKAIVSMAHGLHLQVIAEGVENANQVAFLRKCKCDQGQGTLFSQPLAGDSLTDLLREGGQWGPS